MKAVGSFAADYPFYGEVHNKLVNPPNLSQLSTVSIKEIVGPFPSHLLWNLEAPNPSRLPLYRRVQVIFSFWSFPIQLLTVFSSYYLRMRDLFSNQEHSSIGTNYLAFSISAFSLFKSQLMNFVSILQKISLSFPVISNLPLITFFIYYLRFSTDYSPSNRKCSSF